MDEEAFNRAKLLLIVKFLHELQHRATRLLFNLEASSEPATEANISCQRTPPTSMVTRARSRSASKKGLLHTPESVGSMNVGGVARGDSGYALEEKLLGGRLRHRHLSKGGRFEVRAQAQPYIPARLISF
jgi:hypothetical protein